MHPTISRSHATNDPRFHAKGRRTNETTPQIELPSTIPTKKPHHTFPPENTTTIPTKPRRNTFRLDFATILMMLKDKLTQNKPLILKAALLLIVIATAIIAITWITTNTTHQLRPGEVNQYMGQNLSKIDDFRENSIKGPQNIDINTYTLTITGLVNDPKTYTYDEILNTHIHYEKVVTLHCVEGWDVTILWEGILVKDLLNEAGIDPQTKVVIFYAYDGYSTALPLDFIINQNILIAYKMNGLNLPPERGFPFQLVAESKYGYKWIKWITQIELSDNENYLGYWESRGFSNDANVP
jgi:DMSO/TMAO reductase YedYZ molybdopterin-dependent catalytic subunit